MRNKDINHIYFLSGLGADKSVFKYLDIPLPHSHISWIDNKKNESLSEYAKRILVQIEQVNPILIGLSFGGIIAQEIAKHIPVKQIILISTIKNKQEKPWYINLTGKLMLPLIIPNIFITKANFFTYWIFGVKKTEGKSLLRELLKRVNPSHIRWAMIKIAKWDNSKNQCKITHIHTKGDRVLPNWKIKVDYLLDGGHFSIFTNPKAFKSLILYLLN